MKFPALVLIALLLSLPLLGCADPAAKAALKMGQLAGQHQDQSNDQLVKSSESLALKLAVQKIYASQTQPDPVQTCVAAAVELANTDQWLIYTARQQERILGLQRLVLMQVASNQGDFYLVWNNTNTDFVAAIQAWETAAKKIAESKK